MSTFVFDLNGTIFVEDDLFPGARETIHDLRAAGHDVLFASNNTSHSHAGNVQKLRRLGIAVEPDQLVTAAQATVTYLKARPNLRSLLVLGPQALRDELAAQGLSVRQDTARPVDAVVVGRDDAFSYARLRMAQDAVFAGAHLIATDGDRHVPHRDGLRPGTAVITAALEAACFTRATVIGKLEPGMLRTVMERVGAVPARTVMVGDSIVTDIGAAREMGLFNVYVLSGIARFHLEPLIHVPSLTIPSVASLIPALQLARADLLER